MALREPDGLAVVFTGMFLDDARESGIDLYVSHFATCPKADEHRKHPPARRRRRR